MSTLITITDPRSAAAEAYRALRTNLAFNNTDNGPRSLLLSSPAADTADKSEVIANLAVVTAQSGWSVILVDADLRRPAQHICFGLENGAGLSNALDETADSAEIPLQDTGVDGLRVLTSGPLPENPAERIASKRMSELIQTLSGQADILLFDAPPLIAVTDAAVLAPHVDGVVLALAAGLSRRDHARKATALLEKVDAKLLGTVLTGVKPEAAAYG